MNEIVATNCKRTFRKLIIYMGLFVGLTFITIIVVFPRDFFFGDLFDLPSMLRSPPPDEEMIANFYTHREDFDRLARIYREDTSVPAFFRILQRTPEIAAIMARIKVRAVEGDGEIWIPPDPYSLDPDFQKEKLRYEINRDGPEARRFSGVIFCYAHQRVIRRQYGQPVYKEYYYIPVVPKVEDGVLRSPGTSMWGDCRVVETLNQYPPNFATFNCVYRKIEPQWFVRMCQHKQ